MSRASITILRDADKSLAHNWINQAKPGTRVEFKANKRTLEQNARLWAMLTDVAVQIHWDGKRLTTNEWKLLFLDGLKRELKMVPSLDGTGLVNIGRSSSELTKEEFSDLIELIHQFGAENGVTFHDPESRNAS